jgi:predicted DNA-binding transcriptional regulator AlpA
MPGFKMNDRSAPVTMPTGLRRADAARHCGVSPGHFDRMVREGFLPSPRNLPGTPVWLRQELDDAMFSLPVIGEEGGQNSCDAAFGLSG